MFNAFLAHFKHSINVSANLKWFSKAEAASEETEEECFKEIKLNWL